jgi:cytochrome c
LAGDAAFDYSQALRTARDAGLIWDEAKLRHFLREPDEMFPGLWMSSTGLRRDQDIAAVVEFLAGRSR